MIKVINAHLNRVRSGLPASSAARKAFSLKQMGLWTSLSIALILSPSLGLADDYADWMVGHSDTRPENLSSNNSLTQSEAYQKGQHEVEALKQGYEQNISEGQIGGERLEAQLKSRASQTQTLKEADTLVRSKKQVNMDYNHPFITRSEKNLSQVQTDTQDTFGVSVEAKPSAQKLNLKPILKTCREAAAWEKRTCQSNLVPVPVDPTIVTIKVGDKQPRSSLIKVNLRNGKISGANDPESIVETPLGVQANEVSMPPTLLSIEDWKFFKKGNTKYTITQYPKRDNDFTVQIKIVDPSAETYESWKWVKYRYSGYDWDDPSITGVNIQRKKSYFTVTTPSWNQNRSAIIKFKVPMRPIFEWVSDCARLEKWGKSEFCNLVSVEKEGVNESRRIPGSDSPIAQPHWAEKRTYFCGGDSEKNECETLRQQGCLQIKSKCAIKKNNICIEWEHTYQCSSPHASFVLLHFLARYAV